MFVVAAGSGSNQPMCPSGTYNAMTGLTQESQCTDCTEGYYCEDTGLTAPTAPCHEGMSNSTQ